MKKLIALIVDDSLIIIERIIEILSEMDNIGMVLYAGNYAEGLQMLEEMRPDIALLDINLPDKSGIDLLRFIKQQQLDVKVIMISNQASEHHKKVCANLGASYFFDKSNEFEQIPGIISNIHVN